MGEGLLRSSCATGSADARVAQVAAKRVVKCIVADCVLSVCMCVFECLVVVVVVSSESCIVMVVMICPWYHEHFLYTDRMLYFSTYLVSSMYNSTYRLVLLLKLDILSPPTTYQGFHFRGI